MTQTVKSIKRTIIGQERFDPDALDGDGDGLVQDSTIYERPANQRRLRRQPIANIERKPTPATAGMTSGRMANENPSMGKQIPASVLSATRTPESVKFKISYGKKEFEIETPSSIETSWTNAYDGWVTWPGNFGTRVASHSLMGLPSPHAFGFNKNDLAHQFIVSGDGELTPDAARYIADAVIGLTRIDSGDDISQNPIYRGLMHVGMDDQIYNLKSGDTLRMGLSAFTSDRQSAIGFAVGDYSKTSDKPLLIEIEPGAKYAPAMGEQYLHEFERDGQWVIDITEYVTQGEFEVTGNSSVRSNEPGVPDIKIVRIKQKTTFNPLSGEYTERGKPSQSGKMFVNNIERKLEFDRIRATVDRIVPGDVAVYRSRLIDGYLGRNLDRYDAIQQALNDKTWLNYVNPDGSPVTEQQFFESLDNDYYADAEPLVDGFIYRMDPQFDDDKVEQLRYMTEIVLGGSPQMVKAFESIGYPIIAIDNKQSVETVENGKPKLVNLTIDEIEMRNLPSMARGQTSMIYNAVRLKAANYDFKVDKNRQQQSIQENMSRRGVFFGFDPERLLNLKNGIASFEDAYYTSFLESLDKKTKIAEVDLGLGTGILRHELSHSMHTQMINYINKWLNKNATNDSPEIDKIRQQFVIAKALLNGMLTEIWSDVPVELRNMLQKPENNVSVYAESMPVEWVAETLAAMFNPSKMMRDRVSIESKVLVSLMFPIIQDMIDEDI